MTLQMDLQTIIVFDGIYIFCVRLMYFAKTGTERFFKNQVFTLYCILYRRNAEIGTQIETWFFGIIHCT